MINQEDRIEIEGMIEERVKKVIGQMDILPDSVKQRHVGEGVRFIRAGLVANRPTTPERDGAVYYATDEDKLYVGDGSSWLSETLT